MVLGTMVTFHAGGRMHGSRILQYYRPFVGVCWNSYVLMCVHFLQQRKPAVLPCLQVCQRGILFEHEDLPQDITIVKSYFVLNSL